MPKVPPARPLDLRVQSADARVPSATVANAAARPSCAVDVASSSGNAREEGRQTRPQQQEKSKTQPQVAVLVLLILIILIIINIFLILIILILFLLFLLFVIQNIKTCSLARHFLVIAVCLCVVVVVVFRRKHVR